MTSARSRRRLSPAQVRMLQNDVLLKSAALTDDAEKLSARLRLMRIASIAVKLLSVVALVAVIACAARFLWPGVYNAASTSKPVSGEPPSDLVSGNYFADFDANGDERISSDELRTELQERGYNPTENEVLEILRRADADSSGTVGSAEFTKLVEEVSKIEKVLVPVLPWWAYLLIVLGLLIITGTVAWIAFKKSLWMVLYWTILIGGLIISFIESQLYGAVFGPYIAAAGFFLIVVTYFLRWVRRKIIDPVAERMKNTYTSVKESVDALVTNVGSMSESVKKTTEIVVNKFGDAKKMVTDTLASAQETAAVLQEGVKQAGAQVQTAIDKAPPMKRVLKSTPVELMKAADNLLSGKAIEQTKELGVTTKGVIVSAEDLVSPSDKSRNQLLENLAQETKTETGFSLGDLSLGGAQSSLRSIIGSSTGSSRSIESNSSDAGFGSARSIASNQSDAGFGSTRSINS
jgi:hypothetical protein